MLLGREKVLPLHCSKPPGEEGPSLPFSQRGLVWWVSDPSLKIILETIQLVCKKDQFDPFSYFANQILL